MDTENGMDGGQSTVDDSDSAGNSKPSSSVTAPSGKEKKKTFFKKVSLHTKEGNQCDQYLICNLL